MQPATKHYLFFGFLLISLAVLVALVLWQWHRARADGAEPNAQNAGWHGHAMLGGHEPTYARARWVSVPTALQTVCAAGAETRRATGQVHVHVSVAMPRAAGVSSPLAPPARTV